MRSRNYYKPLSITQVAEIMGCCSPRSYLESNLSPRTRRYFTMSMAHVTNILMGIEYAVIFPTVWRYIQKLGVHDETYLGLTISVFNISGMIAALSVGWWCDRTERVRLILLCVNLPQLLGQAIYFAGFSAESLILARFISGFGLGMNSAIYSEIIRGTSKEERTMTLSCAFLLRQVGIMMSPGFNIFIRKIPEFEISVGGRSFQFNEESAPGFIMFVAFALFEVFVYLFFFDMRPLMREINGEDPKKDKLAAVDFKTSERTPLLVPRQPNKPCPNSQVGNYQATGNSNPPSPQRSPFLCSTETAEKREESSKKSFGEKEAFDSFSTSLDDSIKEAKRLLIQPCYAQEEEGLGIVVPTKKRKPSYINEFLLNPKVIPLFFLQMICIMAQALIETVVPPFTQEYFNLGPAEISWIFMCFGLGMMAAFVSFIFIVSKTGKKMLGIDACPELNILLFGVVATIVAFVGYLIIAVNVEYGKIEYLWAFIGVSVIMLVADPASITTVTTLISLMVHEDVQGMAMGIRRCFTLMGLLIGPMLAGSLVFKPWILYGGAIFMSCAGLIMLLTSYNEIQRRAFGRQT